MIFKIGDKIEFDAMVTSIFPQNGNLLVGLKLASGARVSLHDRWILRSETGPLLEGEAVRITAKVTLVSNTERGELVSSMIDGSTMIWTHDPKLLRKAR